MRKLCTPASVIVFCVALVAGCGTAPSQSDETPSNGGPSSAVFPPGVRAIEAGEVYTNEALGMTLPLPAGWYLAGEERTAPARDNPESAAATGAEILVLVEKQPPGAAPGKHTALSIVHIRPGGPIEVPLPEYQRHAMRRIGERLEVTPEVVRRPTMCELGGVGFSAFDLSIPFQGGTVLQRQYDRFVGDGVLNIQLVAPTREDLAALARIIDGIAFDTKGERRAADAPPFAPSGERSPVGPEILFDIFWANEAGQRVFRPGQAYPDEYDGQRREVSLRGVHVQLLLGRKYRCADINEAARKLADLGAREPSAYVNILAVPEVPWKWVALAVDACARARIGRVSVGTARPFLLDPSAVLVDQRERSRGQAGWPGVLPFAMRARPPKKDAGRSITICVVAEDGPHPLPPRETYALDGRTVSLTEVAVTLVAAAGLPEPPAVMIAADAEASFKPVLQILRACAKHGLRNVSFAVQGISAELFR